MLIPHVLPSGYIERRLWLQWHAVPYARLDLVRSVLGDIASLRGSIKIFSKLLFCSFKYDRLRGVIFYRLWVSGRVVLGWLFPQILVRLAFRFIIALSHGNTDLGFPPPEPSIRQ